MHATKVKSSSPRKRRYWYWSAVATGGSFPYLHVVPCSSRAEAAREVARLNSLVRGKDPEIARVDLRKKKGPWRIRRCVMEFYLPRESSAVPGLPVPRCASALGRP